MKIELNGEAHHTEAENLAELCQLLELGDSKVATALNGMFVPEDGRHAHLLRDGDKIEILTPREGG